MTARRPDHIRLSALVRSRSTDSSLSTPAPSLAVAPRNEVIFLPFWWGSVVTRPAAGHPSSVLSRAFHQSNFAILAQLSFRLAVNTHNMGGRFVESVKNARWSLSPQEAGDGLESSVEF